MFLAYINIEANEKIYNLKVWVHKEDFGTLPWGELGVEIV